MGSVNLGVFLIHLRVSTRNVGPNEKIWCMYSFLGFGKSTEVPPEPPGDDSNHSPVGHIDNDQHHLNAQKWAHKSVPEL